MLYIYIYSYIHIHIYSLDKTIHLDNLLNRKYCVTITELLP